jgi:hypothetical protein
MSIQKEEIVLLSVSIMFMLFASVNINTNLGTIFSIFAIASVLFILVDPKRTIPLRKQSSSLFGSITAGVLAYGVLILSSTFLVVPGINKVIALLGSTTPILSESILFNNLIFGLFVPIIESTFFFGVLPDLAGTMFDIKINRYSLSNLKLWLMVFFISFLFMFFHLTSKGISAYTTLGVVFVMALISMILVIWNESYESAILFHVLANSLSLLL